MWEINLIFFLNLSSIKCLSDGSRAAIDEATLLDILLMLTLGSHTGSVMMLKVEVSS